MSLFHLAGARRKPPQSMSPRLGAQVVPPISFEVQQAMHLGWERRRCPLFPLKSNRPCTSAGSAGGVPYFLWSPTDHAPRLGEQAVPLFPLKANRPLRMNACMSLFRGASLFWTKSTYLHIMEELFITYSRKKIKFRRQKLCRGMHFHVGVYRMTQKKLAEMTRVYSDPTCAI